MTQNHHGNGSDHHGNGSDHHGNGANHHGSGSYGKTTQAMYSSTRPKHLVLQDSSKNDVGESDSSSMSSPPEAHYPKKSRDSHVTSKRERERQNYSLRHHHLHSSSAHHYGDGNALSSRTTITTETATDKPRHTGEPRNVGVAGEEFSTVSEKAGNLFELFRTYEGMEYTVYVREDGKKFYVDFEEQVREYEFMIALELTL